MGHGESGCLLPVGPGPGGGGGGRVALLVWDPQSCSPNAVIFFPGALGGAPKLSIPGLGLGHRGSPLPGLLLRYWVLQVLSGTAGAGCKRHAAGSSCEPVGQLTFQGPKSLCVLDKLFIVVLALPGPSDSNKCSQTGKGEEIRRQP